jgi:hypothetical protein
MQAIAGQLVTQAKLGHLPAIKLLFAYVLGKPAEAVNPDTLDVQEWQLYQRTPVTPEAMSTVLGSMHADLACTILRSALPEMTQAQASHLAGQLDPELTAPAPPPPGAPTATAGELASAKPAPSVAAQVATEPAADPVRQPTEETVSPLQPSGVTAADRQQTEETAQNLWATLAALLDRELGAPDATPGRPEVGGPSASGENGRPTGRRHAAS